MERCVNQTQETMLSNSNAGLSFYLVINNKTTIAMNKYFIYITLAQRDSILLGVVQDYIKVKLVNIENLTDCIYHIVWRNHHALLYKRIINYVRTGQDEVMDDGSILTNIIVVGKIITIPTEVFKFEDQ